MGCVPITIWILLIKSINEVTDAFYSETEEKAKQSQKFQACFDNVDESVVLISGNQIEYVNDRFLLQFIGSIQEIEYSEKNISQPKLTCLQRLLTFCSKKRKLNEESDELETTTFLNNKILKNFKDKNNEDLINEIETENETSLFELKNMSV